jgi:hypothetical protein
MIFRLRWISCWKSKSWDQSVNVARGIASSRSPLIIESGTARLDLSTGGGNESKA